jgi:phosphatidylglycerol:prolipoprotein diacylglycerol transferase
LHLLTTGQSLLDIREWFTFWQGGLAILGAIIGIIISATVYTRIHKIPTLPFFDLMAIYAPLLQSISRVGCFLAGCCYGMQSNSWLSVTYTDELSLAPLGSPLYPTQLFSSFALLIIFILMYGVLQHIYKKPGQLLCWYLILESSERFIIDFWRADRIMTTAFLSYHQIIALSMGIVGVIWLALLCFKSPQGTNRNEYF